MHVLYWNQGPRNFGHVSDSRMINDASAMSMTRTEQEMDLGDRTHCTTPNKDNRLGDYLGPYSRIIYLSPYWVMICDETYPVGT
jgi:hypothetical protein